MTAVADYALRRLQPGEGGGEPLTLQGLAMLLWTFATLEHPPGQPLVEAASSHIVSALEQQQAQEQHGMQSAADGQGAALGSGACLRSVSQVAWAFAKFGHADEALFAALARRLPPAGSAEDAPQSLTLLAYSAAKLRVQAAPELLRALLPAAERHVGGLSSDEACQLLWALGQVGGLAGEVPQPLLDASVARLAADLGLGSSSASARPSPGGLSSGGPDPRLLCMAVHALAALQYRSPPALLDACVRAVAASLPGSVSVSLAAQLLWGCAHVGHVPEPAQLEAISDYVYHQLSHARGNKTVSSGGVAAQRGLVGQPSWLCDSAATVRLLVS